MSQARNTWLETVLKYKLNPDKPGDDAVWCPDLERASRARIKEIQSEKLAAAFKYLYEDSAYYRARFKDLKLTPADIRSVDDLAKIPITTKMDWAKDQQENPPWGTVSPLTQDRWTASGWMMFTSSGTTTDLPRVFRHTLHDRDIWAWLGARAYWAMGVRPGDIVINCFGYGPSVAFWCVHYGMHLIGAPVIPGGGMNTQRRAMFINTYEPTVLACTPSYALHLGRAMEELGMSPEESSIRLVITAGEPGPCVPATKRRIEDLWGAQLHDDFGCTEVAMTPLGYTCEAEVLQKDHPVSTHLMDDAYISEVVHPETLEPVGEGKEGVLVVSNLFSESQPMLRYMMGDWTAVTTEPCACGRTHARAIGGLHGRSDGMIKVRGIAFFPSTIEDSIRKHPDLGDEFQVEISRVDDMDRVKITVEPQSAIPKDSYTIPRDRIQKELKGVLGIDVAVELVPFGSLPRASSKSRRVIDRRESPFRGERPVPGDDGQAR